VEIAPAMGLSKYVCDLVSSGSTLFSNGMKEIFTILESEAVVIGNASLSQEKKVILEKLKFRIQAVLQAKNLKYIALNLPTNKIEEVKNIIPGLKNPTISALAEAGWSSVQAVASEDDFWDIVDALKKLGGQGILVMPIEKVID